MLAPSAVIVLMIAAGPDPAALVGRLAEAGAAERPALAARIEALGAQALPALRAAKRSKDPELRRQVLTLLDKIETGLLIRPSRVTLDFQDRPVAEVVESVAAQAGIALRLEPADSPAWRAARVTLSAPQPLPFWEALDRIGRAGRLHDNPALARQRGARAPVVYLEEGAPSAPVCFSGPFRINVLSLHRRHELVFGSEGPTTDEDEQREAEQFEAVVQVFAEPQLAITLNGPPKDLKARDDFDQDLVPPTPEPLGDAGEPPEPAALAPGPGRVPGTLSVVQFPIALHAPEQPGTTIVRLEGVIPLQAALRRPGPLVLSFNDAAGRRVESDDLTLQFPDGPLELSARAPLALGVILKTRTDALAPDGAAPAPPGFSEPRSVDTLQNRLDIVDDHGQALAYVVKQVETDDAGESRVLLALAPADAGARPAAVRVYSLIVGAIEVPFRFAKLPMP